MEHQIDEIKRKIDIIEFIGSRISLKKTGRNFKAVCPFHQEKTPSFVVSPERQIWHCFGVCQEGGDAIKFLMKWENITFFEALQELSEKTGVKLKRLDYDDEQWRNKERLININMLAAEYYHFILQKTKFGQKPLEYLRSREVHTAIITTFQLGYAPVSWDSLMKFLKKKNFTEDEMLQAGLLVKSDRGGLYDRFRGRLMFPLKDMRGNVIGFSGRNMTDKDKTAKYVNTPETVLYHKRETLFGIQLAKEAIKKAQNAVLVEGEFDMILPFQHNIQNIVAIKGSAVTREQLMLLKRFTNKVTLALDTDPAGEEAMRRAIEEIEHMDFEMSIVTFGWGKDPDEAIRKDEAAFKKAILSPLPIYDFLFQLIQKKHSVNDPFGKKKIGDELVPYLARINNPIIKSHYVKKLADLLAVSEKSVEQLMYRLREKQKQRVTFSVPSKKIPEEIREIIIQKYVLSLIFQNENPWTISDIVFSILQPDDFSVPSYGKISILFLDMKKRLSTSPFDPSLFIKELSSELIPMFDEIYLFASSNAELAHENVEKLSYECKRFSLKRTVSSLLATSADTKESKEQLTNYNTQLNEVEKKIMTL